MPKMIQKSVFDKASAQNSDQAQPAQKLPPIRNRGNFCGSKLWNDGFVKNRFLNHFRHTLLLAFLFINSNCFGSLDNLRLMYELYKNTDGLQFYSQYEQDRYLYHKFFREKKNGVFVDIGAHDGIDLNNTYFFEQTMGWTGICVEPIPEVFERLKKARSAICIEGCIATNNEDTTSFLRVKGYSEMLSGIISKYDPQHLSRVRKELIEYGGSAEVIAVKCYDLTRLLNIYGFHHIDYLTIDTEGGELEILKSIDWNSIEVDIIDVENNLGTNQFQEFLNSVGYIKVIKLGSDEIYVKK